MATKNLPTYLQPIARGAEVPNASWTTGLNSGGANAPGIGINTGNYNPKAQDWPRIADIVPHSSQSIGGPLKAIDVADYVAPDINDNVAFVLTVAPVLADAELDATTGAVNRTGATVPADAWCWGTIPVA